MIRRVWFQFKRRAKSVAKFFYEFSAGLLILFVAAALILVLLTPAYGFGDLATDLTTNESIDPDEAGFNHVNESEVRTIVFEKVNDRRSERYRPLNYNQRVERAAQLHAEDMANNDYFNHTNLDGQTQGERYSFCRGRGENIAYTYTKEDIKTDNGSIINHNNNETSIANGIVQQWMNSKPHREDGIYGKWWTSTGIGVSTKDGKIYVVQGFCKGR